jgi:hypothetical protein
MDDDNKLMTEPRRNGWARDGPVWNIEAAIGLASALFCQLLVWSVFEFVQLIVYRDELRDPFDVAR